MLTAARYCICSISRASRLSGQLLRLNTLKARSSLAPAIKYNLRPNADHRIHTTSISEDLPTGKGFDVDIRETVLGVERSLDNIQEYMDFDRVSQEIQATQTYLEESTSNILLAF